MADTRILSQTMKSYIACVLLILCFIMYVNAECVGQKGTRGPTGAKGVTGDEALDWYRAPRKNWRQCTWTSSDGRDSGTIASCQIYKESSSTALYAAYSGNTRLHNCHGCCGRWYLTFNNAECSNPQVIDGTVYMANYNSADLYRHRVVQGHCYGLSAGWITVSLVVGACSGYGTYDLNTGWNSASRLIVVEETAPMY
ncbi:collagen triple helix repeat-containing protein 1-like [Amphiura filiformis]|uniref:collagen triple helix repeat-containing protein 1-like n=1 Tax=Amphiura filiformis TaxID=82378 RepID=UPI003B215362